VSQLLRSRFRFRCVRIDDPDERNRFEARLIASVAACTVCQPSAVWLGRHAYPQVVQRSGLWNSQYVGGNTADADDPFSFRRLVAASGPSGASGSSLSDTMLIIPCSSAKAGAEDPGLPVVRIGDLLGPVAAATLEEERKIALERRGTSLDLHSPLRPALAWYTGQPYATPGVRERLVAAINRGVHCLIISGGYGVLRAEEPIHSYGAHLPTQTRSVWARRVPVILQDYVTRNGIRRAITVVSGGYASVLPGALCEEDARYVPTFSRGADSGAALRVVPERVGALVAEVLADL
jgi:hypothetical protein